MKGARDAHGNPVPHAHLLVLFNRICKLLYYHIKPVFVFDGATPTLKKKTLVREGKEKRKEGGGREGREREEKRLGKGEGREGRREEEKEGEGEGREGRREGEKRGEGEKAVERRRTVNDTFPSPSHLTTSLPSSTVLPSSTPFPRLPGARSVILLTSVL